MRKKILVLIFISSFLGQCFGQIDSLLAVLQGNNSSPETIDEIQTYFNQTYYQDPAASLNIASNTDSLARLKSYENKFASTQLMLGIAYNINELYDKAINAFLQAVEFAEKLGATKTEAQAYNGLAVVWQIRNDTETSALYFEKALEIYEFLSDTLWVGLINLNLGGLYMEDELLEEADHYLGDAILAMENMNQPIYAGYGKLNLGSLRVKQKRYADALPYLEDALQVVPYKVNPLIHAVGNSALGEALLEMDEVDKAQRYLALALEQSKKVKNYEQLEVVNGLLAKYHEKIGEPKEAIAYFKKAAVLRDSFISKEEDERLVDALKKYEAEKKEQEIFLLSAENEFKDLRSERDKRNLLFALLGLGSLAIITCLVFVSRNKVKRLNQTLEEQKKTISGNLAEKELLLREIHHRVKNNLQVISSLLSLQSNYLKNTSAIQALNLGRDRVQSMALIHQNLYQEGNLTGVKLKAYFENLCRNLLDSYSIDDDKINLKLDVEELDLEVDTVISLGLIANELISNALKHGFVNQETGILEVSLKKVNGSIHMLIADNGSGLSSVKTLENTDSFGYHMINAFKDKLDAELLINNQSGLSVELIFKPD